MLKLKWHNETRKISDLIPYEKNPRQMTEKGMADLKNSIDKFGIAEPIVINTDNIIIGGHARYYTIKNNGSEDVDCYIPDRKLTDKQVKELNVRLNKNIAGTFDFDILANEFELTDLIDWGFEEKELDLSLWNKDDEKLDDVPEVPKEAISKTGDLFLLDGKHRVLCGDSTKKEDVENLMEGNKCDLVITSPPYWNQREYSHWNKFEDYIADMVLVVGNAPVKSNTIVFWNIGDDSPNHQHISAKHSVMLENCGLVYIDAIIWKKQGVTGIRLSHQKTKNLYYPGFSFENCLVFQKDNNAFPVFEDKYKNEIPVSNVWEITTDSNRGKNHLAPFPVKLPETAIKCYSNKDKNKIYEPFAGGGTTLIACQQTNRICYGMEIEPIYIDVILKRYKNLYPDAEIKCLSREYDNSPLLFPFDELFNE